MESFVWDSERGRFVFVELCNGPFAFAVAIRVTLLPPRERAVDVDVDYRYVLRSVFEYHPSYT